MKSFFAEVQRIAEKTCFVSIPAQIVDTLARDHSKLLATLELKWSAPLQREGVAHGRDTQDGPSYGTRSVLVSWSGGSSLAHDRLEVPASLAECLGLPDGVRVETVIRRDIEQASRIDVEPVAHDDWEIIELHAEHLEEQLLNQVPEQHWMLACTRQTCSRPASPHQARVVTVRQVLPLWIRSTTLVRISVTAAWSGGKAVTSALLANGVEVVIPQHTYCFFSQSFFSEKKN